MDCAYIATTGTVAGVSLTGAVGFDFQESGNEINNRSDGQLRRTKTCLTDLREMLTFRGINPNTPIRVGTQGATSLNYVKNTGGIVRAGAGSLVAALSTVLSVNPALDQDGNSSLTVVVAVDSADGSAAGVVWTPIAS